MMLVFVGSRKPLVKIGVHEKLTPWGCWRNRHHQKDHGSILHSDSQSKCPDWSTRLWWNHGSCCCRGAHWSQSQRSKDVLRFNMFEFPSPTTNFPANWLSNFCNLFKQNLFLGAIRRSSRGALLFVHRWCWIIQEVNSPTASPIAYMNSVAQGRWISRHSPTLTLWWKLFGKVVQWPLPQLTKCVCSSTIGWKCWRAWQANGCKRTVWRTRRRAWSNSTTRNTIQTLNYGLKTGEHLLLCYERLQV